MARKMITMAALAATMVTAMVPAVATAQDRYREGYASFDQRQSDWQRQGDDRRDWQEARGDDRRGDAYPGRGYRNDPVRYVYRDERGYYDQGRYRRGYRAPVRYGYRCQSSGTTGAIVGAIAGGLLGNGLAGRGDHTLGALLGGGAGALAGRAVDRSASGC
jgi:Ni/Co efflux regulator RcnB